MFTAIQRWGSLDCMNRATWYILMVVMWVVWLQLISEDLGLKLEKVQPDMLGSAKRVTVSKDDTIILDGGGDKKGIEERCEQVLIS